MNGNTLNRTRLINFRVTPEEYERLREASSAQGITCFSDFARDVLLDRTRRRTPAAAAFGVQAQLLEVEQRVSDLEDGLHEMSGFLDRLARRLNQAAHPERVSTRRPARHASLPVPAQEDRL
jgi:hypothetical protein